MREWLVYLVCGACTALGTVQAAMAAHVQSEFFGSFVLFLIFALHWLNIRIEDASCCER